MDIEIRPEDRAFADEVRRWLDEHLVGEFAEHRGVGGPDDSAAWDVRLRWEKELSAGRWLGLTWPPEYGGRGATLAQAIIFEYYYARAQAPYRLGVQGQDLFGPTLLMFGTPGRRPGSCRRSWPPRSSGGRASASRTPDPIWPRCAPRPG